MSKTSKRPAIALPMRKQDDMILAAAKSDLDAQPLKTTQLDVMVSLRFFKNEI